MHEAFLKSIIVFGWHLLSISSTGQNCDAFSGSLNEFEFTSTFNGKRDTIGIVNQKEISGIDESLSIKNSLWGINDSGNGAELFLFSTIDASFKSKLLIGLNNIDWEDLSTGIIDEANYLFIGDIGDNQAKRSTYSIHMIAEPDSSDIFNSNTRLLRVPETIRYEYEDGSRDAEALTFDPVDKKIFVISKREQNVGIYEIPIHNPQAFITAAKISTLPLNNVVAADFSKDGRLFIVKTYDAIFLWKRTRLDQEFCALIASKPIRLPYIIEPQGESACITPKGYFTLSEERFGIKPHLFFHQKN